MKTVLLSVMTLVLLTSCSCSGIRFHRFINSTSQVEEQRSLKGFERIELLGSLDVRYQQGDSFSVKVQAPSEVIKDVVTRVEGNVLKVNMKGSNTFFHFGISDSDDVVVYVTSPDFLGISLRGSGDFECNGLLDTDNLDIELQGSGDISFENIVCDKVNVSLVGSGDVDLKHVKALHSSVDLVGSGDIKVAFDNSGSVDSHLTGSGDITLTGHVKKYNYSKRGSGEMDASGLVVSE